MHASRLDSEGPEDEAPVVALAADLLFASRIRATAAAGGVRLRLVRTVEEALAVARAGAKRLILDLDLRNGDPIALLRTLRGDPVTAAIPVIAFVSHVREDRIAAARDAGATRVLARSAFVRELSQLLAAD